MFESGNRIGRVGVRLRRCVRGHLMNRGRLVCAQLLIFVFALSVFAVNATACEGGGGGGGELTSLSTKLSGGGKEGEELTVSEGTKIKDKATLTGKDASKATGKVTYKIYSEKNCATLVTSAGEVTVSGESVPASSEEELEAGKAYYWQAHYGGNSENAESTSPCTEVLDVQAKTSLSTKLSGEGKEGEELTINEGSKAEDKATLSGTNSSSAIGKVVYKIYSEKECKTLVKEAGEVTVSSGSVPASNEVELEGEATYYWQASYMGDALHQESKSECGKEILKVKLPRPANGEGNVCERTAPEGPSDCNAPLTSGVTIESKSGKLCTAGPLAIPNKEPGKKEKTYLLTAGHCIANGGPEGEEEWESTGRYPGGRGGAPETLKNPECKAGGTTKPWEGEVWSAYPKGAVVAVEIGKAGSYVYTNNDDYGEICIENEAWMTGAKKVPLWAVTAEWNKPKERFLVTGEAASNAKEEACLEGQRTGHQCGEITEASVGATNFVKVEKGEVKTKSGDSGGPWYTLKANGEALTRGIHTHVLERKVGEGEARFYENLKPALKGLELELLTTNNEVR